MISEWRTLTWQSSRGGFYGWRTRKGVFWYPLWDGECEIELSNSKRDPFCWNHLNIITKPVFICSSDKYSMSTLHRRSLKMCTRSYLAPFSSLGFSTIITILSYSSASSATVEKKHKQLLLQWLFTRCAKFLSRCSNTLSLPFASNTAVTAEASIHFQVITGKLIQLKSFCLQKIKFYPFPHLIFLNTLDLLKRCKYYHSLKRMLNSSVCSELPILDKKINHIQIGNLI